MNEATPWIGRIERRLARWRASGVGPTWVVAVSGGGDSVGLLRLLDALAPTAGLRLSVAHLDHGVRGEAARADAEFVAALAESLGLDCEVGEWHPARPAHFEADARRARYEWLVEVARRRGAGVVAVGHTRDDQAETILHRILRGTGPRGLAGIPRRRRLSADPPIELVRPLLDVSRAEIRAYLATLGQPCREDASNADRSRTRARIRHDLLPRLALDYNPDVTGALVRLGALTRSSERALAATLDVLEHESLITASADRMVFDRAALDRLSRYLRAELIRRAWRRAGWPEQGMSARRWRRLAAFSRRDEPRGVAIVGGVSATTDGPSLVLVRPARPAVVPAADPIPLEIPGEADVPWAGGRVVVSCDAEVPGAEVLDRDRLELPLCVRAPQPGDRFAPLGMDGRSMPLADFFRGRAVPRDGRAVTPLVCDRGGIVWVVGHRIADRVKRTADTRGTVVLSWQAHP